MYVHSSEAHLALSKSERVVLDSVKAQKPSLESEKRLNAHKKAPKTHAYRWRRGGEQIASWRGAGHLPCRRLRPSQRRSPSPASAAPGTANSARRGLPWPCLITQGLNGCRWEKGDEEELERDCQVVAVLRRSRSLLESRSSERWLTCSTLYVKGKDNGGGQLERH